MNVYPYGENRVLEVSVPLVSNTAVSDVPGFVLPFQLASPERSPEPFSPTNVILAAWAVVASIPMQAGRKKTRFRGFPARMTLFIVFFSFANFEPLGPPRFQRSYLTIMDIPGAGPTHTNLTVPSLPFRSSP